MSTIVIRCKEAELDPSNPLHRMQLSIPWPEGAVSAERRFPRDTWEFTTQTDLLRRRRKLMEQQLWWKREYGTVHRRALYVWVFWCPGISGFYEGWWVYLIGRDISYGKYLEQHTEIMAKIMELFPVVQPSLFPSQSLHRFPGAEEWKQDFVKRHQRGFWCGKPQGKAPVWAEVEELQVKRILSRTEWPADLRV